MPLEARLCAANLKKFDAQNVASLPRHERRDALMRLAQMKIDANEDASHLLSSLAVDLEVSSHGRPGTGRSSQHSVMGPANNVFHVPPTSLQPPSTAGSIAGGALAPSIAGSLSTRIADALLAGEMRARVAQRSQKSTAKKAVAADFFDARSEADVEPRPGTAASSRPGTAQRPGDVSSRKPPASPQLLPPVIDYKELLPEDIVQSFRAEYRAIKAAQAEAEGVKAMSRMVDLSSAGETPAEALAAATRAVPLGEVTNDRNNFAPRPLTGHSERSMDQPVSLGAPPAPRPWSKKGRGAAPTARAAQSSVGECLSWE